MLIHRERHRERKNQEELERVQESNFENSKLMRQNFGKILSYMHQIFDV